MWKLKSEMSLLRNIVKSILVGLFILMYGVSYAQSDFSGIEGVVERQFPSLKDRVKFLPLASNEETFILQTKGDQLIIQASTSSAASSGLYYYLNSFCQVSISHCGDHNPPIGVLPEVKTPISVKTPFRYRYALNYCTYSYSYPFYRWEDWERELDWMALNGVNLMLAPTGVEVLWYDTLKNLGFDQEEVQAFIPGPAYTAWWLMGNLEGWGGPMSQDMINYRVELQKRILNRMKVLGITPVVQGFCGIVPSFFKERYPDEHIVDQGEWQGYQRPAILLPESPLFDKVADLYYGALKRYYGDDFAFLAGDLFHEGGVQTGVPVEETARRVQANMQKHFPASTWLLQGWNNNPPKELINGLDKNKTLIVNLAGEISSSWKDTDEFSKTPWIWGSVNHFGGKTDMGGQLPVLVGEPHRAMSTTSVLKGIGILPEGIHTNPVVYDLALKAAWYDSEPSLDHLLNTYLTSRYGASNEDALEAWRLMSQSIYGEFRVKGEGTFESIFCARPGKRVTSVSTWGPKELQYNPDILVRALRLLRRAGDEFENLETYRYDLVDLSRQVLSNYARSVYNRSMVAFMLKDSAAYTDTRDEFIRLIHLQDGLLATDPNFLLGRWLEQAAGYGSTEEDRAQSVKNAKSQITYWGPDDKDTKLHDYANKEWAGLIRDYYLPRWIAFYNELDREMAGHSPEVVDYFRMEKDWVDDQGTSYTTEPVGDYLSYVDKVLDIVYAPYRDASLSPEERTDDLLSRMSLPEKLAQMRHIHFKHFNTEEGGVDLKRMAKDLTQGMSFGCIEAFPYSSEQYLKTMYEVQKFMKGSTRLGIPVIPIMEGLHGVVQDGCTVFPQSIAQAATFNPSLIYAMGSCIGKEMRAIGAKQALAPNLDIARELRWGRVEETYGEDPLVISRMGTSYVRGLQSQGLIPTLKHFVAHGTPTAGLNLASVKGGRRELLDVYVKPFESVIKSGGALSVMNCYSSYDHEAVTGSHYYMTSLLRDSLGFQGYVYADWGSIPMLRYFHHTAKDEKDAARQAITAGIDLEASSDYYKSAEELVVAGELDSALIDLAARRILYTKFLSGLFDDPLPDTLQWRNNIHTSQAIELSRQIANESIVLLENKNGFLPLKLDEISSIAVVGPNADKVQFGDYSWTQDKQYGVTPLEGIRSLVGDRARIRYAEGCDLYTQNSEWLSEAVSVVKESDVAIVVVGTQSALLARPSEPATSGEGYDLSDLKLPGKQELLIDQVAATGVPFIVVLVTGKPLIVENIKKSAEALMVQWYGGEQAGRALAETLFGVLSPSGRLPVSFPKSVGHLPCYYNYLPTDKGYYNQKGSLDKPGRDYVFSDPYPSYTFGYGLTYTTFEYSDLQVPRREVAPTDTLELKVTIKNAGDRFGCEVPQLYVRDLVSSVATPFQQLYDFKKVCLQPNESKTVTLTLPVSALALTDAEYKKVVEPGEFEIQVGSSAEHIWLRDTISVGESLGTQDNQQFVPQTILGEELVVSGTVRNVQSSVMAEVRVSSLSSSDFTLTGKAGKYAIKTRVGDVLCFTLDGYQPLYLRVQKECNGNVELLPE